jgi:uncharacterized membrane protein YGL010W
MKSFIEQARCYAAHHQNPRTQQTHWIGVPLITFSLMIFLGFVKIVIPGVYQISLACITTLVLLVYYFRLHWLLALAVAPFMLFLLWLAHLLSDSGPNTVALWIFVIAFISGWTLQLYGHYVSEEKPAFITHLSQIFIAPLYLMAELLFRAGLLKSLKKQIHSEDEEEEKIIL